MTWGILKTLRKKISRQMGTNLTLKFIPLILECHLLPVHKFALLEKKISKLIITILQLIKQKFLFQQCWKSEVDKLFG